MKTVKAQKKIMIKRINDWVKHNDSLDWAKAQKAKEGIERELKGLEASLTRKAGSNCFSAFNKIRNAAARGCQAVIDAKNKEVEIDKNRARKQSGI